MQEDLIGYLLGSLEPDEMQRVTEALRKDPHLRAELDRLRQMMKPLEEMDDIYEPPSDLISRTMAGLPSDSNVPTSLTGQTFNSLGGSSDQRDGQIQGSKSESARTAKLGPVVGPATDRGWHLTDVLGMCAAVLILAGLVLPGILRHRAAARVAACQSQLREAGTALIHYLTRSTDGRFPSLEPEGPLSFSGMYAIELADAELISRQRPLWCASLDAPEEWSTRSIPTRYQVLEATPAMLTRYQRGAGGHYAYSLGIFERGHYTAPRFQGRSGFAILADAPQHTLNGWRMAHEGQGFNVLFEDGHVQFLTESEMWLTGDHPFLNRSGEMEAGLDPDDAALAPSPAPPFLPVGYRR